MSNKVLYWTALNDLINIKNELWYYKMTLYMPKNIIQHVLGKSVYVNINSKVPYWILLNDLINVKQGVVMLRLDTIPRFGNTCMRRDVTAQQTSTWKVQVKYPTSFWSLLSSVVKIKKILELDGKMDGRMAKTYMIGMKSHNFQYYLRIEFHSGCIYGIMNAMVKLANPWSALALHEQFASLTIALMIP